MEAKPWPRGARHPLLGRYANGTLTHQSALYLFHWAAAHGHLPVMCNLAESYHLTQEDVRSLNNYALRVSLGAGHSHILAYLYEEFKLDNEDLGEALDMLREVWGREEAA